MARVQDNLFILEAASNDTATNGTISGACPPFKIGLDGYIPAQILYIAIGVLVGVLAVTACGFCCYRRRAHRQLREAGNFTVGITRGGKK